MKNLCLILILVWTQTSRAAQLWVTTPHITTPARLQDLASRSASQNQGHITESLFEVWLGRPVSSATLDEIFSQEAKARDFFKQGRFPEALSEYEKLRGLLMELPNVAGLEKITGTTLKRLLEIQTLLGQDTVAAKKDAHGWGIVSTAPEAPGEKWRITASEKSAIFVDGKRVANGVTGVTVFIPPGIHQIAALAPGSGWFFQNISTGTGDTGTVNLDLKPVVTGTCQNPLFEGPSLPADVQLLVIFEWESCERLYDGKNWFSIKGVPVDTPALRPELSRPLEKFELGKSPWFWIGLGVIAVGAIHLINQSQEQAPIIVPTHTAR